MQGIDIEEILIEIDNRKWAVMSENKRVDLQKFNNYRVAYIRNRTPFFRMVWETQEITSCVWGRLFGNK